MPQNAPSADRLVTVADLAHALRVTTQTVRRMVSKGDLPSPSRVGKRLYWQPSQVAHLLPSGASR